MFLVIIRDTLSNIMDISFWRNFHFFMEYRDHHRDQRELDLLIYYIFFIKEKRKLGSEFKFNSIVSNIRERERSPVKLMFTWICGDYSH